MTPSLKILSGEEASEAMSKAWPIRRPVVQEKESPPLPELVSTLHVQHKRDSWVGRGIWILTGIGAAGVAAAWLFNR